MLETGVYLRVSTEEQVQEGFSIRAQEQKLKDFIRIKDWSLYKIYADEGISGKNITERPAINEMIEDVKKGNIKNVLVFKIDRLTRNTADLINLIDIFNEYNCAFNSLTESIDTYSATGRMFIKIIGIFAEFERENIAERARLGFERKAREGYSLCTGTISYGYDRATGEKIQVINEKEAETVREIYSMFLNQHMSFHQISNNLNSRNVPTKNNSLWWARTVKDILTNCNYIGNVRYATRDQTRHFETKGFHQPIISEELYNETQDLLKKIGAKVYKKHPKEEHYFAGILVCGKCGGKLTPQGNYLKDKNGNTIPGNYTCRNRIKKTCDSSSISHIKAENAFIDYINKINDFDTIDEIQVAEKEKIKNQNLELINNLNKEIKKLENKEKEVLNLYINGKVDFDNYMEIKAGISKEKKQFSQTLDSIEVFADEEITIKQENIIKNLKENWELLSNIEKRQFLINFVEKIKIINERQNNQLRGIVTIQDVEFSKY